MSAMKIKKGDTVRVITGKDKGKEGKVLVTDVASQRVVVEGVNMVTKHQRPSASPPALVSRPRPRPWMAKKSSFASASQRRAAK